MTADVGKARAAPLPACVGVVTGPGAAAVGALTPLTPLTPGDAAAAAVGFCRDGAGGTSALPLADRLWFLWAVCSSAPSSCRRPSDSRWACGRLLTGQPGVLAQRRRTHCPPRLHTALQPGVRQQASQHVAPPRPLASECQPRLMTLLQCIPSTPPVTRHRLADTPGRRAGEGNTMGETSRFTTRKTQTSLEEQNHRKVQRRSG
ncbi:hypothetical protein EYF80_055882 [Liparis tanakae]|uniref:Uncharacterized protein n=1 Tax=Liparis tanakae TaxID=230148 RepID=A0A4Z2EZD2_9TELE|nr:hypothetical protein EYF80_055882 [Liparis tanakae]